MSTWWYLQCTSHNPPLMSGGEVEQHTHGLPSIRTLIAGRANAEVMQSVIDHGEYFERNTARFLIQHPNCSMQLVSEYGDVEPIPESTAHPKGTP